ncbi:MAG TPA: OmpA family protein [Gemmatimonadales bacterium]|nr:OmpA family protein [Gemmatimonadales bacterium]
MHRPRFFTLVVAALGLAACGGPFLGQQGAEPIAGDRALRTHGHGIDAPAAETGMDLALQLNTPRVLGGAHRDSLQAANRAPADSLEQAGAALRQELAGLIHFEFDRAQIQGEDRATLDRKAAVLAASPDVRLRIAGYCDERGSDEYNLALGNRRAAAVKQYLVEQGIDAGRLDTVSFGSRHPLDPGQNEAAWALNRRAVASGDEPAGSSGSWESARVP